MSVGSSDLVRAVASEKYVQPAILAGKTQFSVAVRDIMQDLQTKGFPPGNYPQVCTAIQTGKFLKQNCIEIEAVDGPPSGLSSRLVVHYRVVKAGNADAAGQKSGPDSPAGAVISPVETAEGKAERLTQKIRGILKEELAEFGGGEAFLRWMRSEEDEPTQ